MSKSCSCANRNAQKIDRDIYSGDCFAALARTPCFFILLSTANRQLSTLFLGAPAADVSFLQINSLGGYPRGGVPQDPADARSVARRLGARGTLPPSRNI